MSDIFLLYCNRFYNNNNNNNNNNHGFQETDGCVSRWRFYAIVITIMMTDISAKFGDDWTTTF